MPTSDKLVNSNDQDFIDLFHHQVKENTPYSNYVRALGISPDAVKHWSEIPALPTDAFKSTNNPSCLADKEKQTTFLTSGTTTETKGAHHFSNTSTYEKSILSGWEHCKLPPLHPQTLILTPSGKDTPHSSLSHMFETLKLEICPTAEFIMTDNIVDISKVIAAAQSGQPVTLLGTALAFLQVFDALQDLGSKLQFAPASWALETGGYKGTERSLSKEELYLLFEQNLKIAESNIWNEYSMTELSSQFYTSGIGAPHIGPPSTRIKVIHPENGEQVGVGEMGYLVIYDLANVESCLAIRTQDLAIYHDPQSFTLIGRDPSALPRGCSRALAM